MTTSLRFTLILGALLSCLLLASSASAGPEVGIGAIPGCEDPSESGVAVLNSSGVAPNACEKSCKIIAKACLAAAKGQLSCGTGVLKNSVKLIKLLCSGEETPEDKAACLEEFGSQLDEFKQAVAEEKLEVRQTCEDGFVNCVFEDCWVLN